MALTPKQVQNLISEAIKDYSESQFLTFGEARKLLEGLQQGILNEGFVQTLCSNRIGSMKVCKVYPDILREIILTTCRAYHTGINVGYERKNEEDKAAGYYG